MYRVEIVGILLPRSDIGSSSYISCSHSTHFLLASYKLNLSFYIPRWLWWWWGICPTTPNYFNRTCPIQSSYCSQSTCTCRRPDVEGSDIPSGQFPLYPWMLLGTRILSRHGALRLLVTNQWPKYGTPSFEPSHLFAIRLRRPSPSSMVE